MVGLALAVLALGPLLGSRGYVLVLDMVFLPSPPLSRGLLGLSSAVPRAVPSDLVAALASRLLPGDVAQKVLLVAVLVAAAAGGARLLQGRTATARATAAVLLAWNPYVAERLALGQWAVLVGYAALPWVVVAAARLRAGKRAWAPLTLALAASAVTPTGGLVALAVLLCVLLPAWRVAVPAAALALVLDGPWLVPALLRPGGLPPGVAGLDAFAARADTPLGLLGSVLSLGGVWNARAVPVGRDAAGLVPGTVLVLLLVAGGVVLLLRGRAASLSPGPARGLVVAAGLSVVVAVAGATPGLRDVLRELVLHVPAAALLRDGSRHLAPLAVLEAAALGLAVEALTARLPTPVRRLAPAAALVPVALLPGLALGLHGTLGTAQYPDAWGRARAAVAADSEPGALLSLPWSAYRAPAWNGRRTVLDPALKAFARRVVADDALRVGTRVVPGEDPLAARLAPLATGAGPLVEPARAAGVRWVLVQHDAGGPEVPDDRLEGAERVVDAPSLTLWRLPRPAALPAEGPPAGPVVAADVLALLALLVGVGLSRRARAAAAPRAAAGGPAPGAPPSP